MGSLVRLQESSIKVESLLNSQSNRRSMMQVNERSRSAPANAAEHIENNAADDGKGKFEGRRRRALVVVGLGMVGIAFMWETYSQHGPLD